MQYGMIQETQFIFWKSAVLKNSKSPRKPKLFVSQFYKKRYAGTADTGSRWSKGMDR